MNKVDTVMLNSSYPNLNKPILVVNDDPKILRVFRKQIEALNVDFEKATTGVKALYKAGATGYRAVFLDLVMEDMDGIDLYETFSILPGFENTELYFVVDTSCPDELAVFNRLKIDRPLTIISRSALEPKLREILPQIVDNSRPRNLRQRILAAHHSPA